MIKNFDNLYLRPMFPDNHFIHKLDDSDWSHIWVGDF
jgi:hypothetical protein